MYIKRRIPKNYERKLARKTNIVFECPSYTSNPKPIVESKLDLSMATLRSMDHLTSSTHSKYS